MIDSRIPTWQKWAMLIFVLAFILMAWIVRRQLHSARGWEPNQAVRLTTRAAR